MKKLSILLTLATTNTAVTPKFTIMDIRYLVAPDLKYLWKMSLACPDNIVWLDGTQPISLTAEAISAGETAVDIDDEILHLAKNIVKKSSFSEMPKFEIMSILNLQYKNKSFDVAFSNGVLEHFTDDEIIKILMEEMRIADIVIFGVPSKYFNDDEFMHGDERYLTREEWRTLITKAKGKVIEENAFHSQSLKKRIKNKKLFKQKEFNLFIIKENN